MTACGAAGRGCHSIIAHHLAFNGRPEGFDGPSPEGIDERSPDDEMSVERWDASHEAGSLVAGAREASAESY